MTLDELVDLNIALEDAKRAVWQAQRLVAEKIVAMRETTTHEFAPPSRTAQFCNPCESDEPPSRAP